MIITETNFDTKLNQYIQLKLSWNIRKMLLINKAGVTVGDMLKDDKIETLLIYILFGLNEPDIKRAIDIIEGWFELFGEYKTLRMLIIIDLKDKFGFVRENNKEDEELVDIFEEDNTEKKDPTHSEILKIDKENLEYAIRVYMKSGYSYEQAIEKDMINFDFFNNYVLEEREQKLNDTLNLLYKLSAWIAIGVNNPKEFPQSVDKIRLRPLTKEEKIENIRNNTLRMFNAIKEEVENG